MIGFTRILRLPSSSSTLAGYYSRNIAVVGSSSGGLPFHRLSSDDNMSCGDGGGSCQRLVRRSFSILQSTSHQQLQQNHRQVSFNPRTQMTNDQYCHQPTPLLTCSPINVGNYYQHVQYRCFDSRKVKRRKKAKNPFKVLGMPEGSLYKDVKRKFLKIAMTNHPDTHSEDLTEDDKTKMRDKFIAARIAFESLTEDTTDGTAIRVEDDVTDNDANFDSWFKNETGFKTPFQFDIDPETMKEVAKMTEKMGGESGGLDRDGGMWTLARMVTSAVKTGGDAATVLRLEGGDVKGNDRGSINGELRRRRPRR